MIITKDKYLKEVEIVPIPDKFQINTCAMDLRIGKETYYPDTKKSLSLIDIDILNINPNEHFLIQSLENITLPSDIMAVVYPRSSTNRRGVTVDLTGIVDPGYSGHLMIPVSNLTNKTIEFLPGERIAQIVFQRVENPTEARESKYQNSGMEAKPDKQEELELLKSGKLFTDKLKEL